MQVQQSILTAGSFPFGASNDYKERLLVASVRNVGLHLPRYAGDISQAKAVNYATLHAVLEEAVNIYNENKVKVYSNALKPLYNAFNSIYPNKYSYHRFAHYIKDVQNGNILEVVSDKRGGNNRKISPVCKNWLLDIMRSGKKYGTPYMHKVLDELCTEYGYNSPSLSWVKKNYYKLLHLVYNERYGNDDLVSNKMPYAGILKAEKSNEQWQIDGWRLPFYMDGWRTLTLFIVLDAYSRKVVGYYVGETENTDVILKALENAVQNTGVLPCEIVSDNHSFNQTKEAENFKDIIASKGCTWTVTSNPRYKSLVERFFNTFGTCFCKDKRGYVGEGIRSRRKNARTTQEELDKYTKAGKFYSLDELKTLACAIVEEYNTTGTNRKESPETRYNKALQNGLALQEADKLQIFNRRNELTVRRGQIDITRGGKVYEYQLNAKYFTKLNNKKVAVRYFDYNVLYVYDLKTDEFICTVVPKEYAHSAKVNQTQSDIDILNKQKGRIEGIKAIYKRKKERIKEEAFNVDPYACEAMNVRLTDKSVLERMKQNGRIQLEASRLGVDVGKLTCVKAQSEITPIELAKSGKSKDKERKPFTKEVVTLEKIIN